MPAFNAERYIGDAIKSCLNQTLEDWQLVITNDCSTDRTLDVIAQFDDPRITMSSLESNSGPGAARNAALLRATGEWITTLDADDAFEPVRLQALREIGIRIGTNAVILDELKDWEIETIIAVGPSKIDSKSVPTRELSLAEWIRGGRNGKPFFHRSLLGDEGVEYPHEVRGTEDFVFMCRLCSRARARIVRVKLPTYIYRRTPGSLVSQRQRHLPEVLRAIKIIREENIGNATQETLNSLEAWVEREKHFLYFKTLLRRHRWLEALQLALGNSRIRNMLPLRAYESIQARARIRVRTFKQKLLTRNQTQDEFERVL